MKRADDVEVSKKEIKCTVKVGKHRHERSIAIKTRRQFNKSVHEIAKMLSRWRSSGKVRKNEAMIILEGAIVDINITRNVPKLGRRIRDGLHKQNITAHA